MVEVTWWTCAVAALVLLPATRARVLERCELANELRRLGVQPEHVATWVCIAFHESRFDTAARNPYSGDHGLLQISELYWCGGGAACGLPCDALRDDDIADDVQCALRVHEEHTRLQGDGFLAWVVYPQYCKQNSKKYLVECATLNDTSTLKTIENTSARSRDYKENKTFTLNPIIDKLKAPYLSVTQHIGHQGNEIENIGYLKSDRSKWQHGHFSNIDELSLPVFNQPKNKLSEFPSIFSTTTRQPFEHIKMIETNGLSKKITTAGPSGSVDKSSQYNFTVKGTPVPPLTQSPKPTTTTVKPIKSTTKRKYITEIPRSTITRTTTTSRPITVTTKIYPNSVLSQKSSDFSKNVPVSTSLNKGSSKKQFTCFGCRTPSTDKPVSISKQSLNVQKNGRTMTGYSPIYPTVTITTTPSSTIKSSTSRTWRTNVPSPTSSVHDDKAVQIPWTNSVFDLYLNTERPKLTTYKFASRSDSWIRRRIFFDGTTSPATPLQRSRADTKDKLNKDRKYFT